jgi:ATP-dependent Clp protease ATP-binding subunit ClpA
MSEYMERHSVSRLVGSPPGYVGHEEGGQLTEQVRRHPYSVILLDELEKAHSDVFNMLLQIIEDGRLTDGKGKTVDFRNTIIIATSNVGSNKILSFLKNGDDKNNKNLIKFTKEGKTTKSWKELQKELLDDLKNVFRPEFLNRIDDIIVFHALTKAHLLQIVDLELAKTAKLLKGQGIKLLITKRARTTLADIGYDPQFGARPLRRVIQKKIENPLADKMLSGELKRGDTIVVEILKKEFIFKKK